MKKINLFELSAKIKLDSSDYERGIKQADEQGKGFAERLKSGLSTAAKVGAAALAAAGTAIVAVTKQAVAAYADYEQLVGGVETLFKDSADIVMDYAANAYKTAGLSANQYMETVTSFSASLLQSLDGDSEAAARAADMAITDMSDNANKMGTSMESIQWAYQGFAKQNYTMLDNLKLGYGGTKEEMERLLADAEELSGVEYDISNLSDVYEAIHVIQTEIGITGTTAEEAAETISGSVAAMRSAWQNMLVGIADDNADFQTLMDNLVDSVSTAAGNILPRVEIALGGIAQLVGNLAPVIARELPAMLQSLLPSLISGATSLVAALVGALPSILGVLIEQLPTILEGLQIIPLIIEALAETTPMLIDAIINIVIILTQSLIENAPLILSASLELMIQLTQGIIGAIPTLVAALPQIISSVVSTLIQLAPQLIAAALQLMVQLAAGLIGAIPTLIASIPQIISAIVGGLLDGMGSIFDVGKNIVEGIWEGISGAADWLWDKLTGWLGGVVDGIKDFLGIHSPSTLMRDLVGKNLALGIGVGFEDEMPNVEKMMNDALTFDLSSDITTSTATTESGSVRAEIRELREAILSMRLVLDTGVVAGGVTSGVNEGLGTIYSNNARRSFA